MKTDRILIADDDLEDLEMIEEAILDVDATKSIYRVTNGKDAIELLNKQNDEDLPSLIILDYNMPLLTGAEVLLQMCKDPRYKTIPKIILSTSNAPLHIHECKNNGATAYFVKPSTKQELDKVARKMLSFLQ